MAARCRRASQPPGRTAVPRVEFAVNLPLPVIQPENEPGGGTRGRVEVGRRHERVAAEAAG